MRRRGDNNGADSWPRIIVATGELRKPPMDARQSVLNSMSRRAEWRGGLLADESYEEATSVGCAHMRAVALRSYCSIGILPTAPMDVRVSSGDAGRLEYGRIKDLAGRQPVSVMLSPLLLLGCGVSQNDYDVLKAQNQQLQSQSQQLEGQSRLLHGLALLDVR
jgi:hypothetical protein